MTSLWLPPGVEVQQMFVCRICGEQIPVLDARSQVTHVQRCSEDFADELAALSPVRRLAEWNAVPDPEWESYNQSLKADGQDPEVQYARGRRSNIRRASES